MRLDIAGIAVRYGAIQALDAVSLSLRPGEVVALLGANGSGKSSLLKAVAGLVPHAGTVTLSGQPLSRHHIGYMAQDISSRAALSLIEVVMLGRLGRLGLQVTRDDLTATAAILARLGIDHLAERFIGELSGGQRQLAYLAQALASDPHILLLDEPISALDLRHQLEVLELIRTETVERGLITLMILHDLNAAARFCDRVAILAGGGLIADGLPAAVITPATIATAFEVEADVHVTADGVPIVTPLKSVHRAGVQKSRLQQQDTHP